MNEVANITDKTRVETYEELYAQLQDIVASLESGDIALEDTVKLYEQGIFLAAACQHLLDTAELRIQQLEITVQAPLWDTEE